MNKRNIFVVLLVIAITMVAMQLYAFANNGKSTRSDAYQGKNVTRWQSSGDGASAWVETGTGFYSVYVSRVSPKSTRSDAYAGTRVYIDSYDWDTGEYGFASYVIPDKDFVLDKNLDTAKLHTAVAEGRIDVEWSATGAISKSRSKSMYQSDHMKWMWQDSGSWRQAAATGTILGKRFDATWGHLFTNRSMSMSIGNLY